MLQITSIKEERFDIHTYIDDAFWCLRNGMVTTSYIAHLVASARLRGEISDSELDAYVEMLKG